MSGPVVLFSRRQPYAGLVRGAAIDEHPAAGFGLDALLRLDGAVDLDPAAGLVAGRGHRDLSGCSAVPGLADCAAVGERGKADAERSADRRPQTNFVAPAIAVFAYL